jgi:hypothetical protein
MADMGSSAKTIQNFNPCWKKCGMVQWILSLVIFYSVVALINFHAQNKQCLNEMPYTLHAYFMGCTHVQPKVRISTLCTSTWATADPKNLEHAKRAIVSFTKKTRC